MQTPFKPIDFLSRDIRVERRGDGTILLQSNHELKPYEKHVPAFLAKWAREAPDRVWLAQRRGPEREWLKVTYGAAKRQVDAVTQALLDRGFGPDKPVMTLSSNSIEFALLTMAAMQARAPLAPVSPAYSVMSQDHAKLRYVFDLVKPGMVFVQNGEIYARALAALDLANHDAGGVLLVHVDKAPPQMQSLPWSELLAARPTDAVARSIEQIDAKTTGKFLFTSGSTGMPKAVINTQEMMCANLAMSQMARTRKSDDPPARRRCAICARSPQPTLPTCRRVTPCWRRHWRRTTRSPSVSSRTSIHSLMAAPPCRPISMSAWKRWQ